MADRVTNEAVLVALRGLGVNITGPISMTGAQNSEWKKKVLPLLVQQYGSGAENVFKRAIETAKKIKDIPVDAKPIERLAATLRAYGTDEKTMVSITNEARRLAKTTPGYRQGGKEFGDLDFAQAAANVMGHTGAVLDAFSNSGVKDPPRPAPGTPGEKVTPPPAPPSNADFTGAPMAADVPGAQKFVRSDIRLTPEQKAQNKLGPAPRRDSPGLGGGGPTLDASGRVVDKALGANASDADIEAYFRKNYGAEAWMLQIPDFKDIIKGVATNPSGWSVQSVISAVQAKPWWQQNGQNVADYLKDKANIGAPAFQQKLEAKTAGIRSELNKYGIQVSDERLAQLGDESYKWGWDETAIAKHVAAEFDYVEGQHTVFVDKLKNEAKQFLVPINEGTIEQWGRRLIIDPNEQGNWQEFLKGQAKSMFADPDIQRRLDGGETMAQIASPYAKLAAQNLEMDEADIDFSDPKWMTALDTSDEKGNRKAMTYGDWIRKIKTDEVYRYDFTEGAKQNAMGIATNLLKTFGGIA